MSNQYTKDQFWKLYEKLPEELKEAISSVETADNIWNICERYGINEVSEVAKLVGNVLLGVLTPEDFQETLERELKLEKSVAKKVAQEINRFIFYPVRTELEKLYQTGVAVSAKSAEAVPIEVKPTEEKKPTEPGKADSYRESVE